jgi:hypothetical protein
MCDSALKSNHVPDRTRYRTIDSAIYNTAIRTRESRTMAHITANDLKTRGIAAIEALLADGRTEAVVSVRGADRYVVMDLAHYQHLRECELEAALAESRADVAAGRFVTETPQAHLARLQALNASDAAAAACTAPEPLPKAPATRRVRSKPPAAAATQRGERGVRRKNRSG